MATELPPQQAWRAPLREGLAWLTSQLHEIHDKEAPLHLRDATAAREGYGAVVGASPEVIRAYVLSHALKPDDHGSVVRAAELLELERGALRSLTSCAWFFDDIGGIETLQVLRYAAWAAALAGEEQTRLESGLIERLAPREAETPPWAQGLISTAGRFGRGFHPMHASPRGSVRFSPSCLIPRTTRPIPWKPMAIRRCSATSERVEVCPAG